MKTFINSLNVAFHIFEFQAKQTKKKYHFVFIVIKRLKRHSISLLLSDHKFSFVIKFSANLYIVYANRPKTNNECVIDTINVRIVTLARIHKSQAQSPKHRVLAVFARWRCSHPNIHR